MTLLQEVSICTAAVVCPRTVFTQLVTDPPDLAVIIVYTGSTVIGYSKTIRAVARTSLRRWVTEVLATQSGAPIQAAGLLSGGVGLICCSRTVRFGVTHFSHWYTYRRAWASPLTRITVSRVTVTSFLVTVIPTVVEMVTHPVLRNAAATGTRELTATTARVRTVLLIAVVPTVVPVVTHKRIRDTDAICTLKLMHGTVLCGAVKFIRSISAVLQAIAVLRVVVTGPISACLLSATWIVAVFLIRVVHTVLYMITFVCDRDTLVVLAGELVWAAGPSTTSSLFI